MYRFYNSAIARMLLAALAALAITANAAADIVEDLELRYRFEEATGKYARDSSGNNRAGELKNGATFISSGRIQGGADLPGTDEIIVGPEISDTDGTEFLTLSFWLNPDSLDDNDCICTKFEDGNNQVSVLLGGPGAGDEDDIAVLIHNGAGGLFFGTYTSDDVLTVGTWTHVAVVYDGTQAVNANKLKVYINGALPSQTVFNVLPATLHTATVHTGDYNKWLLGWRADTPAGNTFDGKIDEFHLYTRALSAGEVADLYNWRPTGLWSSEFNGATSKFQNTSADVLDGSQQVTVCCWFNADGVGENGGYLFALDENDGDAAFFLRHLSSSSTLTIQKRPGAMGMDGQWTIPISDGAWQGVCVTLDFSTDDKAPKARLNYNSIAVTPGMNMPDEIQDLPATGYCVGNRNAGDRTWDGRIAQMQVFNRVLSAAEMDAALRDPGSVKDGLRLWLPMMHAGDTVDRSGNEFNATATDMETGIDGPPYDSRFQFAVTNETIGQMVIPSAGSEPAIGVLGVGTRSKLTADGAVFGTSLITTANFFNTGVIEPTVRDLYLDGNHGVADHPFSNGTELAIEAEVCDAIDIDGDAPSVSGCKIFDFRGDAITVRNSATELSRLIRMPRVTNNKISHCWTGILAAAVDTQIDGNRIANVRDYGIREIAGSIQCSNNHVFGARWGIYFDGGPSRSVGDRFSDCDYGFTITNNASGSHIADGTSEHCTLKSILGDGERIRIHNTRILVPNTSEQHEGENNSGIQSIVGIHLTFRAHQSLISDCDVEVGAFTFKQPNGADDTMLTGSTGVFVEAHGVIIDNLKITGDATGVDIGNEIGVRIIPERQGGDFFIDARGGGFNDSGDCVVKFDTPGMSQPQGPGQVWYILYADGDIPVRISSGWDSSLKIFKRSNSESEWTQLTTGQAQP